jgi:hypothetical protein
VYYLKQYVKCEYEYKYGFVTSLFKDAVQSVCKQRPCLHCVIQNIEFYSTTIYIFTILEYNKLSRDNNQALQEHKMK